MPLFRYLRRRRVKNRPLTAERLGTLSHRVPYFNYLPLALKKELQLHMQVILDEKIFEGCGGLIMTDEIMVVIAAYATILILGDPTGYYPDLKAILVYPDDYVAPVQVESESGIMTEGLESRSGESWTVGSIVLSWRDIEQDIQNPLNGKNLIFHEFAHQLDDRYGISAGIDEYGNVYSSNEWNETLAASYRSLRLAVKNRKSTLVDPYGATNPAEFFSVATEAFFEKGPVLKKQQPDLYKILQGFYHIDPAGFLPS